MAVTSQVTTFSDLYTELLDAVRESTSVTATSNIAKRYINIALQDMHIDSRFWWAIRRDTIVTHAPYSTGTVTISQGATALTGASTAWTTANAFGQNNARVGGKISLSGVSDVYDVTAVGSATSITLGQRSTGSDLSAASYTYYEDEYALATDFWQPVDDRQFTDDRAITLIGSREFYRRWPRNNVTGYPHTATLIELGPSGSVTPRPRVLFHPAPSTAMLIPYRYITANLAVASDGTGATALSGDTDEPIVPLRYRYAIVLHALFHWYRDRKDDARSKEAQAEYTALVQRIRSDTQPSDDHPRLSIKTHRNRFIRVGRTRARYDIDNRFDRFED